MFRKRQQRGFMWAAAIAFGYTAVMSWWKVLEGGAEGRSLVVPIGFTIAAFIWLANVLVARVAANATEGNDR